MKTCAGILSGAPESDFREFHRTRNHRLVSDEIHFRRISARVSAQHWPDLAHHLENLNNLEAFGASPEINPDDFAHPGPHQGFPHGGAGGDFDFVGVEIT